MTALALVFVGCSAADALAPLADIQKIAEGAGIADEMAQAKHARVGVIFDYDWDTGEALYGGGVLIGHETREFQIVCRQVVPVNPGDSPWKCLTPEVWEKQ